MGKLRDHARTLVQLLFTALTNGYAAGFAKGGIYKGQSKLICVPGLNCYSCPGALGSCPIGSFQAVITSRTNKFTFYVIGFLLLFGALFGRLVCGCCARSGWCRICCTKSLFPKNCAACRVIVCSNI